MLSEVSPSRHKKHYKFGKFKSCKALIFNNIDIFIKNQIKYFSKVLKLYKNLFGYLPIS